LPKIIDWKGQRVIKKKEICASMESSEARIKGSQRTSRNFIPLEAMRRSQTRTCGPYWSYCGLAPPPRNRIEASFRISSRKVLGCTGTRSLNDEQSRKKLQEKEKKTCFISVLSKEIRQTGTTIKPKNGYQIWIWDRRLEMFRTMDCKKAATGQRR